MSEKFRVVIKDTETGEVVKTIGKNLSERKAEKVFNGATINLNWDRFDLDIEPEEDK